MQLIVEYNAAYGIDLQKIRDAFTDHRKQSVKISNCIIMKTYETN